MRCLFLLFIFLFLCLGCGKKGPLVYPDLLIAAAPGSVTVHQVGQGLMLSLTLPDKDLAGQKLVDLAGIKVLKRESAHGQTQECNACTSDFVLFKTLYLDIQESSYRRYGNTLLLLDGNVATGRDYVYRIIPFTKEKLDGESSKPVTASVTLPSPPPVLHVFSAPTEIRLEFAGQPPVEGQLIGYNIYRSLKDEPQPFLPLNKVPLTTNSFTDSGLDVKATYRYTARTVVRTQAGTIVESGLSNEVEGALKEEE
ncbi:MAG TPA: fibronectin type III domain-containing protein [Desulfuromonadaceae bacterium]|jgi:predicted small lipoprotein YifL